MTRIIALLVLTVVAAMAAPAQAANAKTKLALNWKAEPQFGGFYQAQTAFKKRNIDVEILPGGSGTPVVQMIAAGQAEFGIVSADEIILARANGADVVAVFAAFQTNPQGIMVHPARGFKTIADVLKSEGTLSIQKGLPYAKYLFKKYPQAKVTVVPYQGGVANFMNDQNFSQQCFVTSEPLAVAKAGKGPTQQFLIADEGYNPYTTVVAVRGETIKNKPQLVNDVVAAIRIGWQEYVKNPKPANDLMAKLNKAMDPETFKESAAAQLSLLESADTKKSGLGTMNEERWKTLTAQMLELKLIEKAPVARSLFQNY